MSRRMDGEAITSPISLDPTLSSKRNPHTLKHSLKMSCVHLIDSQTHSKYEMIHPQNTWQ